MQRRFETSQGSIAIAQVESKITEMALVMKGSLSSCVVSEMKLGWRRLNVLFHEALVYQIPFTDSGK